MSSALWLSLYTKPLPLFSSFFNIPPLYRMSLSLLEAPLSSYALSSVHLLIRILSRLIIPSSLLRLCYYKGSLSKISQKTATSAIPIPASNVPLSNKQTLIYITISLSEKSWKI